MGGVGDVVMCGVQWKAVGMAEWKKQWQWTYDVGMAEWKQYVD